MTPETQITASKLTASPTPRSGVGSDPSHEKAQADGEFSELWANGPDTPLAPEIGLGQMAARVFPVPAEPQQALSSSQTNTAPMSSTPESAGPIPERAQAIQLTADLFMGDNVEETLPKQPEIRLQQGDGRVQNPLRTETYRSGSDEAAGGTGASASNMGPQTPRAEPIVEVPTSGNIREEKIAPKASGEVAVVPAIADRAPLMPIKASVPKANAISEGVISVESGETGTTPMEFEVRQSETLRTDSARADLAKPESPRTETARHVSGQIVEAIRQGRDGTIDVSLNPEELGRVRLTLSGSDAILHVTIQSERPETGELLRRHIAQLQQDFQDLGYVKVSIDFGNSPGQSQGQNDRASIKGLPADEAALEPPSSSLEQLQNPRPRATVGLDLRL